MQKSLGKSFKRSVIWAAVTGVFLSGAALALVNTAEVDSLDEAAKATAEAVALAALSKSTDSTASIPDLKQELQHTKSAKRITETFTRSHYKKIEIDNALSQKIFDRYIRSLDSNKSFFYASDIEKYKEFENNFDDALRKGDLEVAYEIYKLNLERRAERFRYALSLLDNEFKFDKAGDKYFYDREDESWPESQEELNEIWRQRVKYDALNLKMADKSWEETQEMLSKRYARAIKRLSQTKSEDVFQTVMNSFARSIEAHTSYLSPRGSDRFQMEMNLSLEGIGAVLRSEEDYTTIVSLVAGGPADKSEQVKPEDKIVAVAQDDEDFVDVVGWRLDDVVELIKGPKGSIVRLQILKGAGEGKNYAEVTITRDKVKLEDRAAKSEIYIPQGGPNAGQKLGVIEIPSFYHNLHVDVKKELDKLKAENVQGVIVDLRGNGGGSLPESIYLSGLFIDKGPVVQVRYENGRINVDRDTDGVVHYAGPLTVMVDRYSASASEIFAAAMQDYNRAIIVGEQTFGKGTVQQHRGLNRLYDFDKDKFGAIQFTIAKFYRISGGSTQYKGVTPDIQYPSPIDPAEWGESKAENALPYDSIRKANYTELDMYDGLIDVLTAKHNARALKDPEFAYIFEDIAEYNENKDKNYISLVESERLEDKKSNDELRLRRINERLERMGFDKVASLDDDLPDELSEIDPFLAEAANITFDMISTGRYALNSKSS
ncbi:carboxy terminal-processing peptidase [Glaciecola sp. MH2013]|uniref:carboxy terminal-processing peptidase n=1 Tax=Glaciecola sp. MH2013 TaxID=2785524 RepID=UPI00189FB9A4|nr:carboxy terminal-processing peptidase [Glaciecola sp. MH2013]MBF7072787.1 carboxy terminal-processing peptidase [Glaciecola sp. MH2013]